MIHKFTELDDGILEIFIPFRFKGVGPRRIIVAPGLESEAESVEPRPLALYLARAHSWQKAIVSGKYHGILELSRALNLDSSYVRQIFRMVNLVPKIQETILNGTEPDGLTIMKLRGNIPDDWDAQKEIFCFLGNGHVATQL